MKPVALAGPTASGKTAAAIQLARQVDIEVISMDSMAVYRDLPVLSAAPGPEEISVCPHHLIGILGAGDTWTAADWVRETVRLVDDIATRGRVPVIVGGTFFYLKALIDGLDELPPADDEVRARHRSVFDSEGPVALHELLVRADPEVAATLHPNDFLRVSRALEVVEITGRTRSERKADAGLPSLDVDIILWDRDRDDLYRRCDERVERMIEAGLADEVGRLSGCAIGRTIRQAVGFEEMTALNAGHLELEEAMVSMKRRTRHLVKHQQTWMKRFDGVRLDGSDAGSPEILTGRVGASVS